MSRVGVTIVPVVVVSTADSSFTTVTADTGLGPVLYKQPVVDRTPFVDESAMNIMTVVDTHAIIFRGGLGPDAGGEPPAPLPTRVLTAGPGPTEYSCLMISELL